MTPEEIAQDRAVIAAASGGTWATYSPREQGGGPVLASFGTTVDTPDVLVQIRQSRPAPQTDAEFTALVTERLSTPWAQHEANARFAVTAHERWPLYVAEAEEAQQAIAAEIENLRREVDEKRDAGKAEGWLDYEKGQIAAYKHALRLLRGGE